MLVKFEQNRTVQTTRNVDLFDNVNKIAGFISKYFFGWSFGAILEDVSVSKTLL